MLKRRCNANKRWEKTMTDKLSVAVGAGIAVAGFLVLGSKLLGSVVAQQAAVLSYIDGFLAAAAGAFVCLLLVALLRRPPPGGLLRLD
jgi:hypothetical protein